MNELRKAAEMALEALENHSGNYKLSKTECVHYNAAVKALRQALAQPEQEPVEPPSNQYNNKRIAWELERTAMGDGYYGNALYVAMDMAQTTQTDREVLHRYMHGSNLKTDHVKLQDLAMRIYTAPTSKPDDLLRQSEQEGWRWAKECEAEVKRLRTLLAEGGQGCSECGVTVSEGYALYCVKCVEPLFKNEWVSLTDSEIAKAANICGGDPMKEFARAIEAKLKEKNNG